MAHHDLLSFRVSLANRIKTTVLSAMIEPSPFPYLLTQDDKRVLIALVAAEIITRADLEPVAHKKLCADGRTSYKGHLDSLRWNAPYIIHPDHTIAPGALAYALEFHVFNQKEERKIKFDHGDTKESFIAQYAVDTLCERVVDQWLTITLPEDQQPDQSTKDDSLCSCSH